MTTGLVAGRGPKRRHSGGASNRSTHSAITVAGNGHQRQVQHPLDLAPLIADKAIDFELVAPPEPAWIEGHPWMLREPTRNLLHNAIRATPQGAALDLRVDDDGVAGLDALAAFPCWATPAAAPQSAP